MKTKPQYLGAVKQKGEVRDDFIYMQDNCVEVKKAGYVSGEYKIDWQPPPAKIFRESREQVQISDCL